MAKAGGGGVVLGNEMPFHLGGGAGPRGSSSQGPCPGSCLCTAVFPTGSHAYLTLALHWVEPREHIVPVLVSHNTRIWQLSVRGEARVSMWPVVPE